MKTPKDCLGHLSGGKVLDVATGVGGFIDFLIDGLKDYTQIIGIDTNEAVRASFERNFKDSPRVSFEMMNAKQMNFPQASFDTVCIANSLHHMAELDEVILEMKRVLRPGGNFIILEMYRDQQTETQLTHVLMHHWWAAIDRIQGVFHAETYTRQKIIDLVAGMGLRDVVFHDLSDTTGDPRDTETVRQLEDSIDRSIQKAGGEHELKRRGEDLRKRVKKVGFHNAASLMVTGKT